MNENTVSVQEMIDAELARLPSVALEDLRWLAHRIDPGLEEISDDEFRSRFLSSDGARRRRPRRKAGDGAARLRSRRRDACRNASGELRDVVRQSLLAFAEEISAAETRRDLVRAIAGVERHVERIVRESSAR